MRDKYTAQATTTEKAIEKGLEALAISIDEAHIEVTQESKKGFLGIGQRDAVVVVTRKNQKSIVEKMVSAESPVEENGAPVVEKTKVAQPTTEVKKPKPQAKETVEKKKETPVSKERKVQKDVNEKDERAIQKVDEYIKNIATKMGVEDVSISIKRDERRVFYSIDTEDAGLIIGRHGKVLNSLQTLAQIQMHQEADNKLYARVDAENYRDRRQKTVEQLAKRTADKVKRTNRPVILEPMPAHERKQIHRYLNYYGGVQTHSEGKEPHRYLVVEPAETEEFSL